MGLLVYQNEKWNKTNFMRFSELKAVAQRESTLAPIFATFLRSPRQRQQVTPLRRLLAEAKIEYAQLEVTRLHCSCYFHLTKLIDMRLS